MSMLAERKRKQRWSLNPRGKLWTEDTNGFGQKMLQKMGWKHGKGLGAKEDGSTEALKVSYKNDSKGMGYKEVEQWIAHDDHFSDLLRNLNGKAEEPPDNDIKVNSLETKMQRCKARINYHKFTKAKDLSRYTEKDLANILGKKSLKAVDSKINETNNEELQKNETQETTGDILLNRGSMTDYFKKKLPAFDIKNSNYVVGNNGVLTTKNSESENDRVGFGFSQMNKTTESSDSGNERVGFGFSRMSKLSDMENETEIIQKKKKKRKYAETFHSYLDKTESAEEIESKQETKQNKSHQSFVSYMQRNNEELYTNAENREQNIEEYEADTKKCTGNFISYVYKHNENCVGNTVDSEDAVKHRKKKRITEANDCMNKDTNTESVNLTNYEENLTEQNSIEKPKDTKTKKSKGNIEINQGEINVETMEDQNEERTVKYKVESGYSALKKKKSKRSKSIDTSVIIEERTVDLHKDKNDKFEEIQNNPIIQSSIENSESNKITQKRKKSKKKNDGFTNMAFCDFDGSILNKNDSFQSKENCKDKNIKEATKVENIYEEINEDNTGYLNKEKSKKKKLKNSVIEENKDISNNENSINLVEKIEIKNQNEPHRIVDKNISFERKENNVSPNECIEDEGTRKNRKQKKSKKNKDEENNIGISNPAFCDFNSNTCNESNSLSLQANLNDVKTTTSDITPKRKKSKRKLEEIHDEGIDNPLFNISADDSNTSEVPSNPYEVKIKKRRKILDKEKDIGLDNPALNHSDPIPDTDLMLNIVDSPVILKKPVEKFDLHSSTERVKNAKRKSVRFSNVLQERIIPNDPSERMNEYISNRNELFDINTMVVEESVKEEMKKQGIEYEGDIHRFELNSSDPKEINKKVVESSVKAELSGGVNSRGFVNNGFDIRSVDKINFYERRFEVKSPNSRGIDNRGFNKVKNRIEENVTTISNTIDRFQAEVENNINESKDKRNFKRNVRDNFNNRMHINNYMVGDVRTQIAKSISVPEGVKLCFKDMHFKTPVAPHWRATVNSAKKSYRHLIRGDITLTFKNSNLHKIKGYAVQTGKEEAMS